MQPSVDVDLETNLKILEGETTGASFLYHKKRYDKL